MSFTDYLLDSFTAPRLYFTLAFMACGLIIGLLMAAKNIHPFTRSSNGNLPLDMAKDFKKNFEHSWYSKPFLPKTTCIVHNYKKLKGYIDDISEVFPYETILPPANPCTVKPGNCDYKAGVAFYLARSGKDNYAQQNEGATECLRKKNYSVFLLPVLYTEGPDKIKCRNVRDGNMGVIKGPVELDVLKLEKLCSPIEEKKPESCPNDLCDKFLNKVKLRINDQTKAYDLGQTHP